MPRKQPMTDQYAREQILDYVRARPNEKCEESQIKKDTGVPKHRVRNLVRGEPGIDQVELAKGKVCFRPDVADQAP